MSRLLPSYRFCRSILRSVDGTLKCRQRLVNFPLVARFHVDSKLNSNTDLSFSNPKVVRYIDQIVQRYSKIRSGTDNLKNNTDLLPMMGLLDERLTIIENLSNLDELGKDSEMKQLVDEERSVYQTQLICNNEELLKTVIENMQPDDCNDVLLEISAGVGGQEAMLFAKDLHGMYLGYLRYLNFDYCEYSLNTSDAGGIAHATISVSGDGALDALRYEGGVHRVQRIPVTERTGRVHTSTASVAVLPQPTEIEVNLQPKDLRIETKRASGAGGQHVNTTESAVRIVHIPTGISAEAQTERSQIKNKDIALRTLRARIFAKQLTEQENQTVQLRKSQRGLGFRNEKIRTYNYQQDRITDHRIASGTVHNLKGFLEGGEPLHRLVTSLREEMRKKIFIETINELKDS